MLFIIHKSNSKGMYGGYTVGLESYQKTTSFQTRCPVAGLGPPVGGWVLGGLNGVVTLDLDPEVEAPEGPKVVKADIERFGLLAQIGPTSAELPEFIPEVSMTIGVVRGV